MRPSAALLCALALIACDDEPAATTGRAEAQGTDAPAAERAPTGGRPTLVYDLLAHAERAELRQGATRVVDLGARAAHQHPLGGWPTRVGPDHAFEDGTRALLMRGVTGELVLPPHPEGAELLLRGRAFGDGRTTVYVDGETVGHVRFPTDGSFAVARVTLPPAAAGEHRLQLRVPRRGRDGDVRAGLALDWLRMGPPSDGEPAPPLADPRRLSAGWSASWALDVPAEAQLLLRSRGRVRVRAHRDGQAPRDLGAHGDAGEARDVAIELAALAGDVARLELSAEGDATLEAARVVVRQTAPNVRPLTRRPKNVLIFLVDTVRADKLKPFNAETRVTTPGLDAWAGAAAVFTQGSTPENWTKPSVASLLTGLMPWEHTATSGEAVLPGSVETLAERLKEKGFRTAGFVTNGYVSGAFGFRQGWDDWRNYIREGRRNQARFVAADVLEWLDRRVAERDAGEGRPFFLYVHTIDPHVPYLPPQELLRQYDDAPYDGPVSFARDRELLEKIKVGRLRLDARDKRRLEALYDAEITYHDAHFAAILEGLDRRGFGDETVVVFTSDHGEEMFDHGSVGHGHSLYDELTHVPLVIDVPGLTDAGMRDARGAGLQDVVPTVLDALGPEAVGPLPDDLSGVSLLPQLRGALPAAPRPMVAGFMEGWRSVAIGRWKLIQRTHRRFMLFDRVADPGERNDLSAERPLVVRWLRGMLGLALAGQDGRAVQRRRRRHVAETTDIDEELDAQLRALGYVGTQRR
ncbi:MAG: sulfatase [Myxococcota bacterium]